MRIFYDCEFIDTGRELDLISIGMVRDDGRELYAINGDVDVDKLLSNPWLVDNVWPSLPHAPEPRRCRCRHGHLDRDHPDVRPPAQIARAVSMFIADTPDPELWAWYGAYDHVVLAQLYGTMIELPSHIPMFTHDLKQEAARLGDPAVPQTKPGRAHNALEDARHNRVIARFLDGLEVAA